MALAENWQLALFGLLAESFAEYQSNFMIRWLYSDGIPLKIDDPDTMTTVEYFVPVEVLTDDFLRAARAAWQAIPKRKEEAV